MENVAEEIGPTVQVALESWHHTARLAVLLVVAAVARAVVVVATTDHVVVQSEP
jgi:hypothetical protein